MEDVEVDGMGWGGGDVGLLEVKIEGERRRDVGIEDGAKVAEGEITVVGVLRIWIWEVARWEVVEGEMRALAGAKDVPVPTFELTDDKVEAGLGFIEEEEEGSKFIRLSLLPLLFRFSWFARVGVGGLEKSPKTWRMALSASRRILLPLTTGERVGSWGGLVDMEEEGKLDEDEGGEGGGCDID
jgi:hypothetical protein